MAARDDLLVRAKLAEQAERYSDMAEAMKGIAQTGVELSNDERNMFSVAFKHLSGAKRTAWRAVSSMEQTFEDEQPWKFEMIQNYRERLQEELEKLCTEVAGLIDGKLLGVAQTKEAKAFYYKMKGDYFRYQAEVVGEPDRRRKIVSTADRSYKEAIELAERALKPTNPIRLGLALNYAVFLYEVKNAGRRAIRLAQEAFEAALGQLDSLKQESYKDSTIIMQLIRDNVKMWSTAEGKPVDLLTG